MIGRWGFHVDLASCTGCKACQVACKDKNNLPVGVRWRRVVEVNGGGWVKRGGAWLQNTITYFLSTACHHCEQPICAEVCPTKAITQRDDGIVLIDGGRCTGCRYCEWACPYGAPQFDTARGVMTKCDFCVDEVDQGKPPACVQACQMRVIEFGNIEELRANHGDLIEVYPLPKRPLTNPSSVLTPHRDCARADDGSAHIANREEL
jgi:anaerobic dimethyl sulfoxide reductase subunit B (iron-sulfur subunit)